MGKLTLHGATVSPFVRKVKLVLLEKGIDHDHEPSAPSQDPEFLKISPLGKIPVLIDEEGRAINDSSVIVSYLEDRFPEKSVLPQDSYQRSRARWFEEYADGVVSPNLVFGIFGQRIVMPYFFGTPTNEETVQAAIESAPKFLSYLEAEIKGKDYFVENTYGLADISIASTFCNLRHADFHIDQEKFPELAKWFERLLGREDVQQLLQGEKGFIDSLKAKAQSA